MDTRNFTGIDSSVALGAEFAAPYHDIRVQGEFIQMILSRAGGDLGFDSHYVMISKLFGGERYRYSHSRVTFKSIRPRGDYDTYEVGLRYVQLDLSDNPITGGNQSELSLGVSWVLTDEIQVKLNYSDIDASPNHNGASENVSLWSLRIQYDM